MKLDYILLDVFTTERLSGNPLAVVTKADGLHDDQMQRIAAEFNLSETVFIKRPQAERHTAPREHRDDGVRVPADVHRVAGDVRDREEVGDASFS